MLSQGPKSTEEATQRVIQILDANYRKADIQAIVNDNCSHLTADQKAMLLKVLQKIEPLFDGTLGDWKTKPVSLPQVLHLTMAELTLFQKSTSKFSKESCKGFVT